MTDIAPRENSAHGLRRVLEAAGVAFATVDEEGHLSAVSSGFGRICGRAGADLVGLHLLSAIAEDDQAEVLAALVRILEGVSDVEHCELTARDHSGTDRRLRLTLGRSDGPELVAVAVDVTAADRAERRRRRNVVELARLVTTDATTGLPSRAAIDALLASAVRRSARHGHPFAAILVGVDRRDDAGPQEAHDADERAERLADRLLARLRPSDEVCRAEDGGFVVIAEDLGDVQDAAGVAYRLLAAAVEPLELTCGPVQVGLTLGVAVADGTAVADQVLDAAGVALERARTDGTGGFRIVDLRPGLAA